MQYMAFSSILGTVSFKLLQRLSHKLQIRATVPSFRLCLKLPLKCCHIYFMINSSAFAKHFVSWASRTIYQNLWYCIHLSLLSTAVYYTHFYCCDVSFYLVFSAFHCCYLISGFLLWSNSFISVKLDIPHWFAMTAYSGSPSLHLRSHADSLKIFF